jgi:hypothetical protein
MKTKGWNLPILLGILLGASLGGIVAFVIVHRRSEEGAGLGVGEVRWRDLIGLIGPVFALGRQLLEIGRREVSKHDML